jgi:hypothetical protein
MSQFAIRLSMLAPTFRSSCHASARTFHELRKVMGTSKSMILVPLLHLKFLDGICRLRCRNFKWAALAICATALMVIPAATSAKAKVEAGAGRKHMQFKKHRWHSQHYGAAWSMGPAQPALGYYAPSEPVCPAIGKSFDCKIWPPPYADDPDRKTSRY